MIAAVVTAIAVGALVGGTAYVVLCIAGVGDGPEFPY